MSDVQGNWFERLFTQASPQKQAQSRLQELNRILDAYPAKGQPGYNKAEYYELRAERNNEARKAAK